jgi:hypothetical protein
MAAAPKTYSSSPSLSSGIYNTVAGPPLPGDPAQGIYKYAVAGYVSGAC